MTSFIIAVVLVTVVVILLRYTKKEAELDAETRRKAFKIDSIMRNLQLDKGQSALLNEGLLLLGCEQPIQIKEIRLDQTVLLVNRMTPKKQKRVSLYKLDLTNLDNIRTWILNNLYTRQLQ